MVPRISVTGVVDEVRKEADGDIHILFRVDREFESLLSEKNIAREHGHLVLEPICQRSPTQEDAREPCSGYEGPYFEPQIGQRYLVWGAYVYDADHGCTPSLPCSPSTRLRAGQFGGHRTVVRHNSTPCDGRGGLMLSAGFLALRVQVEVAEESGKQARA